MPISSGDIQFVKTQVMDDAPEGGGGPTGTVIPSGSSNEIFPDISETDRAIGNVRMRKVVLGVETDDVDTFLGSNIIVSLPPDDENVDVTLFSTDDMFDRRADAVARLEAYLNVGPTYAAYLYGNHIAGQNTLLIYQKTDVLPPIGATLVLTKREGYEDESREYVRVTQASSELQSFDDANGTYTRHIVTLTLQNFLEQDFGGFNMQRFDYTQEQVALKTKLSDTVVADAARYYGVSLLEDDAVIGDFTLKAASMFSQLVPSAQVETPIADARTNQLNGAVVSAGGTITQSLTAVFSTTQNLFIGGGIAPATLTISNGALDLSDTGGRLMNGGTQVGNVDYENGVLSLTSNVYGTSGVAFVIVYSPAAVPQSVTQSQGFAITPEGRALSFVRTIEPTPVPGTLSVSYMAAGRWYVLRDDGSGAVRGSSTAFGAGSLNPVSGTLSVTLGALPDVGSSIIMVWVEPEAARASDLLTLDNDGKFYWPFNTSGVSSLSAGAKAIEPGAVTIEWSIGAADYVATDDGAGNITGDATGTVNYANGTMRISPDVLPAPGTTITVSLDTSTRVTSTISIASGSGSFGVTGITPGSVSFEVTGQLKGVYLANPIVNWGPATTYRITDDGAGVLQARIGDYLLNVGTINYSAGTFVLTGSTVVPYAVARLVTAWDNIYKASTNAMNMFVQTV